MLALQKEFDYYLANQDELVKKYNGLVVVIIGEEVVDDYENFDQAYFRSEEKYQLGTFLLQKCSPGEKDYTITIHGGVRFAQ